MIIIRCDVACRIPTLGTELLGGIYRYGCLCYACWFPKAELRVTWVNEYDFFSHEGTEAQSIYGFYACYSQRVLLLAKKE